MLRQSAGKCARLSTLLDFCSCLRGETASKPVSVQRHDLPRLCRRNLATRAVPSTDKQRWSQDKQKERDGPQRTQNSIYPDSKAADRRHPNAPQLFLHFKRRVVPGQEASSPKSSKQRSSSDTFILRNVSADPGLKQLYTSLGMAADAHDAVQASRLCQLIKERKVQIVGPSGNISFETEEKVVFLAVMRALAHHGMLAEAKAINADMLSFGFEESIDSLNCLLQAAIICGDEKAIGDTLQSISALQPPTSLAQEQASAKERSGKLAELLLGESSSTVSAKSSPSTGLTLPLEMMRNWNSTTLAHMLDSACQDHNLEYALLLLSTCYRMGLALPHQSLSRLITLCVHCDEYRTAVELAGLVEQGGLIYAESASKHSLPSDRSSLHALGFEAQSGQIARRLPPSIWMSVLRACAEGGYLPGVELAWSKAVIQGLLSPDDGLVQLILALAAKEGSVQMAYMCLRHIDPTFDLTSFPSSSTQSASEPASRSARKMSRPSKRIELQEWHLAPLFEAQCSAHDYDGAMRSLHAFHCRGIQITERITSRISTSIYPDKACLQLARDALSRCATNPAVGTHKAIANAVISAAVWLGDLAQALEIYHAMRSYHCFASPDRVTPPYHARKMVEPNLDTFNSLLSGCIDAADYETGVQLLKDLNQLKMRPNVVTFERMIVLCLTQSNYDDAFGLLEEAKDKDIIPSRKSYEAVIRKCFHEKDHRWESVLADMKDQGYRPNPQLVRELEQDADSRVQS